MTRLVFVIALAFALCCAHPARAAKAADGYDGLIAPSTPAPSAGGKEQGPVGYSGLIPGRTPAPAKKTDIPADGGWVEKLKRLAGMRGQDRDGDGVPDGLTRPSPVTAAAAQQLARPQMRSDGLLPAERMTQARVDAALAAVKDAGLSRAVRAEKAAAAVKDLTRLADGFRVKKSVPDKTYAEMGVPARFVREQRESEDKSLARLDAAIAELKTYSP